MYTPSIKSLLKNLSTFVANCGDKLAAAKSRQHKSKRFWKKKFNIYITFLPAIIDNENISVSWNTQETLSLLQKPSLKMVHLSTQLSLFLNIWEINVTKIIPETTIFITHNIWEKYCSYLKEN